MKTALAVALVLGSMLLWLIFQIPQPLPKAYLPPQTRVFQLMDFDPPKHVYAFLQDVETHEIFPRVYISKHCNAWREHAHIGRTYVLHLRPWTRADGTRGTDFLHLPAVFCGR